MFSRVFAVVAVCIVAAFALSCSDAEQSQAPTDPSTPDSEPIVSNSPLGKELERKPEDMGRDVPYPEPNHLRVVSTYPGTDLAEEISVLDSIEVVFSRPIDCSTISLESFSMGEGVTGTFDCEGSVVTFHSNRAFEFAVFYIVTLSMDIRAIDGSSLARSYSFYVGTEVDP